MRLRSKARLTFIGRIYSDILEINLKNISSNLFFIFKLSSTVIYASILRREISVRQLIALSLKSVDTTKNKNISTISVSMIKPKGIQLKYTWKVSKQALTNPGLHPFMF